VWQNRIVFVDRTRTEAYCLLVRLGVSAAFLLLILGAFAWATPSDNDSYYVSLGPRNGYHIVQPDSHLYRQLGLYEAPVIDTADWMRHGYGADALAFRFNRNGVLIVPPAYIAQEAPNDFYTRRIGSLARGRATVHDVEALFGRSHIFAARPDGFMWYYALEIYNPFEEHGGDGR
jgi:hypothetical protein